MECKGGLDDEKSVVQVLIVGTFSGAKLEKRVVGVELDHTGVNGMESECQCPTTQECQCPTITTQECQNTNPQDCQCQTTQPLKKGVQPINMNTLTSTPSNFNVCSYQNKKYPIGQNITTLTQDVCHIVTLQCVEGTNGAAQVEMVVDKQCSVSQECSQNTTTTNTTAEGGH